MLGSSKSFLTKDLGAFIALGQDWFGHRIAPCEVTYVMLEGEEGLRNRAEAWEIHNGNSSLPALKPGLSRSNWLTLSRLKSWARSSLQEAL